MQHLAKHQLPISNGFGSGGVGDRYERISVHCGRCAGFFEPDRDWVERYIRARRREYDRAVERGYATAGQLLDWKKNVDDTELRLREFIDRMATA